jgi:Double zinc ribbon
MGLLATRDPAARTAVLEGAPMRCPCCDADTLDGSKFCIGCGSPLRSCCSRCGADNRPRAKFCRECDTALTGQSPALHLSHFSPPHRYTPGHVVEKILTSKSAPEGERKQVTVLFADLQEAKARLKEVL